MFSLRKPIHQVALYHHECRRAILRIQAVVKNITISKAFQYRTILLVIVNPFIQALSLIGSTLLKLIHCIKNLNSTITTHDTTSLIGTILVMLIHYI